MIDRELHNYELPHDEKICSVQTRVGDIFTSQMQTIVCPCGLTGTMNGGISSRFKEIYPGMYDRYKDLCSMGKLNIGALYVYTVPADYKKVLCFPTKTDPKKGSKIEYIVAGLRKFVDIYEKAGITSVAFPMLGCRKGGLRTSDVFPIMLEFLKDIKIPVEIWFLMEEKEPEMSSLF